MYASYSPKEVVSLCVGKVLKASKWVDNFWREMRGSPRGLQPTVYKMGIRRVNLASGLCQCSSLTLTIHPLLNCLNMIPLIEVLNET